MSIATNSVLSHSLVRFHLERYLEKRKDYTTVVFSVTCIKARPVPREIRQLSSFFPAFSSEILPDILRVPAMSTAAVIPLLDPSELYRPENKNIEDFRLYSENLVSMFLVSEHFIK